MSGEQLDPRTHAYRDDLADARLEGVVKAERYVEGELFRVATPLAPFHKRPSPVSHRTATKLMGEPLRVFEIEDGWAWARSEEDGYVGYVMAAFLSEGPGSVLADATIVAARAPIYAEPNARSRTIGWVPMAARVALDPSGAQQSGFLRLGGALEGCWLAARHVEADLGGGAEDASALDWVAAAERLMGAPYVWGGDSVEGVDCSGLVAVALRSVGLSAPRDSDMQEDVLGEPLPSDAPLQRGDLIFWRGHVGIMRDGASLLHANAHAMSVSVEPLEAAMARIAASEYGEATSRKRI